jgi:hypothetical protein
MTDVVDHGADSDSLMRMLDDMRLAVQRLANHRAHLEVELHAAHDREAAANRGICSLSGDDRTRRGSGAKNFENFDHEARDGIEDR